MARDNRRNGTPRVGESDSRLQGDPYADIGGDSGPVDLVAVRRDDAFIDAIRGDGPIATDDAEQYQLALLLANWRAEIVAQTLPSGPSLDEVADAVDQEILASSMSRRSAGSSGRRLGFLRPIAGAAAAVAVVLGGLVVISYNSAPGDPLWSVKSVVFSQQADSTVAQLDTSSKLQKAEDLIASGDASSVQAVQELLDNASSTSGSVIDAGQRSELEMWLARLLQELQALVPTLPALPTTLVLPPNEAALVPPAEAVVPVIPPTSVPAPPVDQAPVVTSAPEAPTPTQAPEVTTPPVTTTTPNATVVREPSTTATASGQDILPQSGETSSGS